MKAYESGLIIFFLISDEPGATEQGVGMQRARTLCGDQGNYALAPQTFCAF